MAATQFVRVVVRVILFKLAVHDIAKVSVVFFARGVDFGVLFNQFFIEF